MLLLNPQTPAVFVDIIVLLHYHEKKKKDKTSEVRIIYILRHTQGVIKGPLTWKEWRPCPSGVSNPPKELHRLKFLLLELLVMLSILGLLVTYISPRAFSHIYCLNSPLGQL